MSTVGGYNDSVVGYHEYARGCSVHRGLHTNSMLLSTILPIFIMVSHGVCTYDIPLY